MSEDERRQGNDEVQAHGAKEIAGVGLAAAALIGAGAVGVKLATDDDQSRSQGALVDTAGKGSLANADSDRDGYVNYRELAHEGFKLSVGPLNDDGFDVTAEGLASAGHKIELSLVDKERGFALEGDTIVLKGGVDESLDELAKGLGAEWTKKHREIDLDQDGFAGAEELGQAGYKYDVSNLEEAGYKFSPEELEKAGIKIGLATLGEGGFMVKENLVMLKRGVDVDLDAFLIKGEER